MEKQTRVLRQSGIGLVLLLGVGGLMLTGCNRGGSDDTSNTPQTAPVAGTKPGPAGSPKQLAGAPPTSGLPGTPGGPNKGRRTGPGLKQAARPGAKVDPFAAPGATAPGGATPGVQVASVPKRKGWDPFYVNWHQPPPPPDPLAAGDLEPIRVASVGYQPPPEKEVTVREVPDRRVSGIMSGDGVFAIIEQNGESEVVKPGGTTKDGYRVVAINDDSVKLQKKVGNLTYTQTVLLSDVQTGAPTQGAYGRPGGFGQQAGYPGMGPMGSGLGRPGAGRPGGMGGGSKAD